MILCGKKLKTLSLSLFFLGLGIFSALTPANAASISTSSLLFYYPFTDANTYGNYTYQEYTNIRNLTQYGSNSAYSANGKFGGSIYSDNNPGSGASSADFYTYAWEDLSFKPTTEFAFSFWYKGGMNTGEQIVYSSINSMNINLQPENSNSIRLEFKNTSDQYVDLYCNNMVDFDNNWHHVVIQGTQGQNDLTFYLDGTAVCTGGSMQTLGNYHTLGYMTAFLANGTGNHSASWGFRGYLDDFALLNRKLTTDEITALQTQSIKTYIETEPAPTGTQLSINYQNYQADNKTLYLRGTCNQNGSGQGQMNIYLDSATSTINQLDIFAWNNVPGFVSCESPGIWSTYIRGADLSGEHTVFIDDTFYHSTSSPNIVSITQDFTYSPVPIYASSTILGLTPDELACSAEEWESADWWVNLRCGSVSAFYSVLNNLQQMISSIINAVAGGFVAVIRNIFPFNVPVKINDSWVASASSSLPVALQWLDMSDSNGNIYATIPKQLLKSQNDLQFMMFGADMFGTSTSTPMVFISNFKAITPFINWIALIWALWAYGSKLLYDDLTNKVHKAD